MSEKTARQMIEDLKQQYKDDPETLEEISRGEKNLDYIERKEAEGNYTGISSINYVKMLKADIEYWN